jgi:hypothetical protein
MKYYLVLISSLIFFAFTSSEDIHIGKWEGKDKNTSGTIILEKDFNAQLVIGDKKFGGDSFIVNGKSYLLKYEIDYTKNPIWLDFIVIEQSSKIEKGRLQGIIEFVSNDKLKLLINFSGNRYTSFDNKPDDILLLNRIE